MGSVRGQLVSGLLDEGWRTRRAAPLAAGAGALRGVAPAGWGRLGCGLWVGLSFVPECGERA